MIQRVVLIIILALMGFGSGLLAQEKVKHKKPHTFFSKDSSHWQATVPLWVPGFRGALSYGEYSMEPSEGEGGRFNPFEYSTSIEFYFVGKVAFRWKRLFTSVDIFSGTIGNTLTFKRTDNELIKASVAGIIPRFVIGYYVYEDHFMDGNGYWSIGAYTGLRFHYINISSDKNQRVDDLDLKTSWTDILIGVKIPVYIKRWAITTQLDVGGFEDIDKLSWWLQIKGEFRVSKLISLPVAWNSLSIKYDKVIAGKPFEAKIKLAGPMLGVVFHF